MYGNGSSTRHSRGSRQKRRRTIYPDRFLAGGSRRSRGLGLTPRTTLTDRERKVANVVIFNLRVKQRQYKKPLRWQFRGATYICDQLIYAVLDPHSPVGRLFRNWQRNIHTLPPWDDPELTMRESEIRVDPEDEEDDEDWD